MAEAADRSGGFLQIGFECRYSKLYTKIKDWIDAGYLGDVVNTNCYHTLDHKEKASWRNKKSICGSMFNEKLSHYVDLPRWWIGSAVQNVYTQCSPNTNPHCEVRDNYQTTYRFANGAVSHISYVCGVASVYRNGQLQGESNRKFQMGHALRYLIMGTKGAASTDIFERSINRWRYADTPEGYKSVLEESLTWPAEEDHEYYHNSTGQTHDIVNRVSQGLPPKVSPWDAYETMRLCFAADKSADTGKVVTLNG